MLPHPHLGLRSGDLHKAEKQSGVGLVINHLSTLPPPATSDLAVMVPSAPGVCCPVGKGHLPWVHKQPRTFPWEVFLPLPLPAFLVLSEAWALKTTQEFFTGCFTLQLSTHQRHKEPTWPTAWTVEKKEKKDRTFILMGTYGDKIRGKIKWYLASFNLCASWIRFELKK